MDGKDLIKLDGWALILGASSGIGEACCLELARLGMNIFGVHLDRKCTMPNVERIRSKIKGMGREAVFFNINAADPDKRKEVLDEVGEKLSPQRESVRLFFHSLAFGTLRPFISVDPKEALSSAQLEMTMDVMANSLVYWIQDIVARKLMGKGGRVLAMTSAGGQRVWPAYGAVSAAKAALESYVRQLALELAPMGITVNAVRAGVTDTPALRKIPGHEKMIELASNKNPGGRMTTPLDVARAVALLCHEGSQWISGNVIGVDGGEFIVD